MIAIAVHDGHNSAACAYRDGEIVYAIQEERIRRVKNYFGFPTESVKRCLAFLDASPGDVDYFILSGHYVQEPKPTDYFKTMMDIESEAGIPTRAKRLVIDSNKYFEFRAKARLVERIAEACKLGFSKDRVTHVDHHLAHALTVYYGLRENTLERYLVVTLDGAGDRLCATVNIASSGKIERVSETSSDDSLGLIYALVTHHLGFMPLEHEYKLMGIAPYASEKASQQVAEIFRTYLDLDPANPLVFRRKVPEATRYLGPRLYKDLKHLRFDWICGGLQLFTEELLSRWIQTCVNKTGIRKILASGGVFMNVKANQSILDLPDVESFQAFPSCGDETLPIGACYWAASQNGDKPRPIKHYFLGDDIVSEHIDIELAKRTEWRVERPENMAERVAELLASGKIVARCAGRMEFGARALGNRSILADPINHDVVRVINHMIKNRDFWMPFAPVARREDASKYFINSKQVSSPYMMMTFDTTDQRREMIAAIHNADFTARPQIIEPGQSPNYEEILSSFAKRTGRSVLLNTSLNLHGHPIVHGPADAFWVMENSGLEVLVIDDKIVFN